MAPAACCRMCHAHLRHCVPARHAGAMTRLTRAAAPAHGAAGPGCRRDRPGRTSSRPRTRGMATAAIRRCRRTPPSPRALARPRNGAARDPCPACGQCIRPKPRPGRQARSRPRSSTPGRQSPHGSWRSMRRSSSRGIRQASRQSCPHLIPSPLRAGGECPQQHETHAPLPRMAAHSPLGRRHARSLRHGHPLSSSTRQPALAG